MIGVPVTTSLTITFDEPIITDTLFYAVTPDPGGWSEIWRDDNTMLSLDHANWAYSQTYTTTIAIDRGTWAIPMLGSVPNPWAFTTVPSPYWQIYLPLVVRE